VTAPTSELDAANASQVKLAEQLHSEEDLDIGREIFATTLLERAGDAVPAETREVPGELGGVPMRWVSHGEAVEGSVVLFVHGGGLMFGASNLDSMFLSRLSRISGGRTVNFDYRLAPENPYPAALDDALAVYAALSDEVGASQVVVAGESAGSGVALLLLQAARDAGLPMPAGAVLISPMLDYTASGETFDTNKDKDQFVSREAVVGAGAAWLQDLDPAEHSPLFRDLSGLPPFLVQVGDEEAFLDDARELAKRVRAADGKAEVEVWQGVLHMWHTFPRLSQSAEATERIGQFVRERTSAS
jgi:monoterpene epsilon-lactone hydrolase